MEDHKTDPQRVGGWAEWMMFEIRWLLYPINCGLILALCVYLYKFLMDVYDLGRHFQHLDTETIRVAALGLVDTAMVANLLVMIIQGSHQIFIRKFQVRNKNDQPQWLDHIDSGALKVKVALSVVGITLIKLLESFVSLKDVDWEIVKHQMIIHVVCLFSALFMALIWRIMHPSPKENGNASPH